VTTASCPNCGEPVEPRQLVCLNCGARVALREPTSLAREPATALAAVILSVIVVGAGLFGFAISELTSGDGGDGSAGSARSGTQTVAKRAPAAPAVVSGSKQKPQRSARRRAGVPSWPKGLTAHTVVLVTSSDRPAALNVAREARRSGLEAGLLPSDPYNLGSGLWIVYSGQFTTREGAARQASQLAGRYPGAYPQLIQRSQ
jgi:hypothetical protein